VVTSQVANALTLYLWGRLSDRLSNKAILAVALPVYFVCTLGLVFTDIRDHALLKLGLLYVLHVAMGAATGGIGLATGNLGLKLAPQGEGTAYLAVIGLVSALCGGAAPLVAGWIADWFETRELSMVVRWVSPARTGEVSVFAFAHWEFLFDLGVARPVCDACVVAHPRRRRDQRAPGHPGVRHRGAAHRQPPVVDRRTARPGVPVHARTRATRTVREKP
jgi:MFS family permease